MSDIQQQLYTKLEKSFITLRDSVDYSVKNREATSIINELHNFMMTSQNPVNLKQRINDAIKKQKKDTVVKLAKAVASINCDPCVGDEWSRQNYLKTIRNSSIGEEMFMRYNSAMLGLMIVLAELNNDQKVYDHVTSSTKVTRTPQTRYTISID